MPKHTSAALEDAVDVVVESIRILHRGVSNRGALGVRMARIAELLRDIGPYAAIELILPGGSLIALVLWLCRRDEAVSLIMCATRAVISKTIERAMAAFTQSRAVCRAS